MLLSISPNSDTRVVIAENRLASLIMGAPVVSIVDRGFVSIDQRRRRTQFAHACSALRLGKKRVKAALEVAVQASLAAVVPDNGYRTQSSDDYTGALPVTWKIGTEGSYCAGTENYSSEYNELIDPAQMAFPEIMVERRPEQVEGYLFFGGLTPGGDPSGILTGFGGDCGCGLLDHLMSLISNASPFVLLRQRGCSGLRVVTSRLAHNATTALPLVNYEVAAAQ